MSLPREEERPSDRGAEAPASPLRPDGRRVAIHPQDVRGRFIRARRVVFALLVAVYGAAPLVEVGGHPAVHLDVEARRFYLLGGTFNAQDVWIVLFLLTAGVFALLFVTAWRGRLWCGWACPQTVFLEGLYRPIERLIEGPRNARLRRLAGPWTAERLSRAAAKHAAFLALSALIAHVALALFLSPASLAALIRQGPAAAPAAFGWAVAVTGVLYGNFAWFREQLCVVLCPYGRLQSIMHDRDSVVIGYDARRGEPRGRRQRAPRADAAARGDCVDCGRCVYACPTGIDIRNGFQMECLACAQCVDACDEVMVKLGRPRGLVRYASQNDLEGKPTRVARPRLFVYLGLAAAALLALVLGVGARTPFEANLLRPPGVPWVIEGDRVRNQFELHLVNKASTRTRFAVAVDSPVPADVQLGQRTVDLDSLAHARVPIVVTMARPQARVTLTVLVTDGGTGTTARKTIPFLSP